MLDISQPKGDLRFLRRADAASYVNKTYGFPCSRQWLAKLAMIGGGPVFRKAGRFPLYKPSDLDAWAHSRIGPAQASTSDAGNEWASATDKAEANS
jgi:hypothetical protein